MRPTLLDAFICDPFALPALVILVALAISAISDGISKIHWWKYGTCRGVRSRRCRICKEVQFIIWKAGEQGHKKDFWTSFNSYWWDQFIPDAR